jgi:hypothetical protein
MHITPTNRLAIVIAALGICLVVKIVTIINVAGTIADTLLLLWWDANRLLLSPGGVVRNTRGADRCRFKIAPDE